MAKLVGVFEYKWFAPEEAPRGEAVAADARDAPAFNCDVVEVVGEAEEAARRHILESHREAVELRRRGEETEGVRRFLDEFWPHYSPSEERTECRRLRVGSIHLPRLSARVRARMRWGRGSGVVH